MKPASEKRVYKTDSQIEFFMERLGNKSETLKSKFRTIFSAVEHPAMLNTCGNVRVSFTRAGKAKLSAASSSDGTVASYVQISSALALYRAVSVFETGLSPARHDFYKMNWSICLLHKPSGEYLVLGEWKGGFQIFTQASAVKQLPKSFVKDVEAFLTWFVSNKVSIGYDGVVAGSVA